MKSHGHDLVLFDKCDAIPAFSGMIWRPILSEASHISSVGSGRKSNENPWNTFVYRRRHARRVCGPGR
jgi:hypothetical protein